MFGYIKKDKVMEIVQSYYDAYEETRSEAFKRVLESATSDEGLDKEAARDDLCFACASHAIYVILKEIERL